MKYNLKKHEDENLKKKQNKKEYKLVKNYNKFSVKKKTNQ